MKVERNASVAQSVVQLIRNQQVESSSLFTSSTIKAVMRITHNGFLFSNMIYYILILRKFQAFINIFNKIPYTV